jgi:hypothetical protein
MIDIDASSRHTPAGRLENAIGLNLALRREWRMRLHGLWVFFISRLMFMLREFAAVSIKNGRPGEETSGSGLVREPEVFRVKPVPGASNRLRATVGGRG